MNAMAELPELTLGLVAVAQPATVRNRVLGA